MNIQKFLLVISGAASILPTASLHAQTISLVGTESGTPVSSWSSAAVPKAFAFGGTEKYGTSGYYQIRTSPVGTTGFADAVVAANDLGITATTFPTVFSKPAFVDPLLGGPGLSLSFPGYPTFLAPDGVTLRQQGSLAALTNLAGTSPSGASVYQDAVYFTLNSTASFRLGIVVDTLSDGTFGSNYVALFNTTAGAVFSSALTRDGVPDMVFFDLAGNNGDVFSVSVWQNGLGNTYAGVGLVTFDVVPEPSTFALAMGAGLWMVVLLRRLRSRV